MELLHLPDRYVNKYMLQFLGNRSIPRVNRESIEFKFVVWRSQPTSLRYSNVFIIFQVVTPEMKAFMKELRKKVTVALVSGSDFPKVQEQMGSENGEINPNLTLTLQLFDPT